ncbi:MAG TPA: lytic transglycosylase domain-containing protein [Stellaceae bacterium]|nr:lytic transglycosylase domain-containing protein [Stellaceae bacterium]
MSENDQRIYVAAFDAAKRGNWAAAEALAAPAHDRLPAAALAFLNDTREGTDASFSDIAGFVDAHPDWPEQKLLRERAEEAIATATDAQLVPWFQAHPPITPAAQLREAQIWLQAGRQADAQRLIRQAWINGDYSAVEEKFMLERYHDVLRGEDNTRRIDRLLWDRQTDEAKHMLKHVGPETAALAQARMGLAAMSPGVERLIAKVPARLQNDPGLLFDRMRWRRHKDMDDDAAAILEHPPADLVRPDAWAAERLIIARRLLDDGQAPRAYKLAAGSGLSTGPVFAELEFLAGWIALRDLNQPGTAYNHFVHLYHAVVLPISLARGAYWSARAAEAMNNASLAATWYETAAPFLTTYYGQLAAAHLGATAATFKTTEPAPTAAETQAFDGNELVQVARDLAQIGDPDDVGPFLRRITDEAKTAADYALTARLAHALARPDAAVFAAKRASYAGITLMDEGYPLADLPPGGNTEAPLVLAMTRQESAFDSGAISNAGARGLMQLMPATANKVAQLLHLPFSRDRLTNDIGYNVTLGRAYLDSLVGNFSGSYVLAVAAYNAGPARVHQWIEDHGDPRAANVDPIDWIERIPYTETRNYVQRVLENLQVYRFRLGAAVPTLSLASDLKR